VHVTARAVPAATPVNAVPASLVAFGALWSSAVLSAPDDLVAAVARAIECELPAALGLPPEAADELARAALGAVVAHLRGEAGSSLRGAERTAALDGARRVDASAPRTGRALATPTRQLGRARGCSTGLILKSLG